MYPKKKEVLRAKLKLRRLGFHRKKLVTIEYQQPIESLAFRVLGTAKDLREQRSKLQKAIFCFPWDEMFVLINANLYTSFNTDNILLGVLGDIELSTILE